VSSHVYEDASDLMDQMSLAADGMKSRRAILVLVICNFPLLPEVASRTMRYYPRYDTCQIEPDDIKSICRVHLSAESL
jgi:hypothetical protein